MGMWTTENQDTLKDVLRLFAEASHVNYGNHSYAAGYLESVVVDMLQHCPKRYQKRIIQSFIDATAEQESQVLHGMRRHV
jgi:hypothetical protein